MKKQRLFKLVVLLVLCCAMLGCGKEDPLNPTNQKKSIYGTVTDFTTGELVSNANVRLNPIGETTLTGSDGMFQFTDVPDGKYSLSISKNGYADLDDDYIIEIKNGKSVRRDVQLVIGVESFKVTVNGIEVDTVYMYSTFLVTNNGTITIRDYGNADGGIRLYGPDNSGYDFFSCVDLKPNEGVPIQTTCYSLQYFDGGNVYLTSGQVSKRLVVLP